jgi:hypothetical protein
VFPSVAHAHTEREYGGDRDTELARHLERPREQKKARKHADSEAEPLGQAARQGRLHGKYIDLRNRAGCVKDTALFFVRSGSVTPMCR